jgi:hypothetical protein
MASGTGLTIANMAAAQQPDIRKGTLEAVANKFPLSDVLPFISTNGALVVHAARINPDDQPPQAYRNINSDGIFGAGSLEAITENLAIYHAALKIDKYIKGDSTYLFSPSQQVDFLSSRCRWRWSTPSSRATPPSPSTRTVPRSPPSSRPDCATACRTGPTTAGTRMSTRRGSPAPRST